MGNGIFKQRVGLFQACLAPVSSVNQHCMKNLACYHLLISPCPSLLKYKVDCPKTPFTFFFSEFILASNLRTFQAASIIVMVL